MFDVTRSPELQAVILALKTADRAARRDMNRAARVALNQLWKPTLATRASTDLERKVLVTGARSKVGNEGFSMLAGTSRRALSGGLIPESGWPGAEFGMTPKLVNFQYKADGKDSDDRAAALVGTGYSVRKITGRQFRRRKATGYVVYPTVRATGPKVVAAWAKAIIAVAVKAVDGRG